MDSWIKSCLDSLQFQNSYMYRRMEVVPLFSGQDPGPEYLTLDKALAHNRILITEVSKGGAVPEIRVENRGKIPVLLLDGEEIAGAKQNRVLNTTILVPGESSLVIPVSCTERGRWEYESDAFRDSHVMMDFKIRSKKMASVGRAMKHRSCRESDQGEIWESIEEMSGMAGIESPTGALKDVADAYLEKMSGYLEAFPCEPGQKGILVYLDNHPAGMEFLSRPEAYARVHGKVIRSYSLDALLSEETEPLPYTNPERPAEFLKRIATCPADSYPGVGLGTEHRIEGTGLVGSALACDQRVLHMACISEIHDDLRKRSGLHARHTSSASGRPGHE
jgi:hypothetical protein